jgi:hypothetical protein
MPYDHFRKPQIHTIQFFMLWYVANLNYHINCAHLSNNSIWILSIVKLVENSIKF